MNSGSGGAGGGASFTALKRLMTEYKGSGGGGGSGGSGGGRAVAECARGHHGGADQRGKLFRVGGHYRVSAGGGAAQLIRRGPAGTPYEGGVFPALISFPRDYPLSPPQMRFTCKVFHPNVYADGRVCISILHPPGDDPNMYESSSERWSPVQSVEKILLSVISMLAEPNDESGANIDASVRQAIRRPRSPCRKYGGRTAPSLTASCTTACAPRSASLNLRINIFVVMATAAAANESRSELLGWVNDLLQLNVSKIESIGTGAVLCQIMDSIYGAARHGRRVADA